MRDLESKIKQLMQYIRFFSLLLLLAGAMQAQAQANKPQRTFSGTAVAGFNMSQIDGDAHAGYDKLGLNIGGRIGIGLAKKVEMTLEILYSQKGAQSKFVRGQPRTLSCRLDYIELPVEVHFRDWQITNPETQESYMRVRFGAGLSYSRLMGGKLDVDGLEQDMDRFRDHDLMMMFSGTFYFTRNWGLNLRWSRSLLSITNVTTQSSLWPNAVSKQISLRAFFTF